MDLRNNLNCNIFFNYGCYFNGVNGVILKCGLNNFYNIYPGLILDYDTIQKYNFNIDNSFQRDKIMKIEKIINNDSDINSININNIHYLYIVKKYYKCKIFSKSKYTNYYIYRDILPVLLCTPYDEIKINISKHNEYLAFLKSIDKNKIINYDDILYRKTGEFLSDVDKKYINARKVLDILNCVENNKIILNKKITDSIRDYYNV